MGNRGVRLSGGHSDSTCFSACHHFYPEILILDEATNALDNISEHLIQEVLHFGQNRTVIVTAYRSSTIQQADQIIVMARVREQGNIQSLFRLNDLFAKLYHLQYDTVQT
ncbi:hypothetical protein IQ230_14210 [Gloeocapsopsis crepidinum LEGE 06123]|uniref:Uncharacterized protein n=1 Tax=Gloeocapsopsis crepidinum LEGE 06123 TaxID=588587 RepID=A0ABR9UT89_9CHRO|nr:hypothetical protein [Gloeocapsopsis crepidinum]MBE9191481.1 hypothetical protein [Gloeocapsopsis crepidinum LEGE 06123]